MEPSDRGWGFAEQKTFVFSRGPMSAWAAAVFQSGGAPAVEILSLELRSFPFDVFSLCPFPFFAHPLGIIRDHRREYVDVFSGKYRLPSHLGPVELFAPSLN